MRSSNSRAATRKCSAPSSTACRWSATAITTHAITAAPIRRTTGRLSSDRRRRPRREDARAHSHGDRGHAVMLIPAVLRRAGTLPGDDALAQSAVLLTTINLACGAIGAVQGLAV